MGAIEFVADQYFTRKVIAGDRAPPLPFVLKGERGPGGEGRAAACSTRPLGCTRALLRDQCFQLERSHHAGMDAPNRCAPLNPRPLLPLSTRGEGETFGLTLRNSRRDTLGAASNSHTFWSNSPLIPLPLLPREYTGEKGSPIISNYFACKVMYQRQIQ